MRSTRDFFVGIVTGLSVGLLIAPRTGEESRRWLKEEYDKRTKSSSGSSSGPSLQEQAMTLFEQLKEQINNYIGQSQNHKKRMADTGRIDHQRAHEKRFSDQVTPSAGSSGTSGLHEHSAQIIQE